jgi:hypothetical protein
MEFKIHLCMFCVRLTFMKQKRPGFVLLKFWCNINIGRVAFVQQLQNYYFIKHILLFNNKQLDRTQVSQLRNVFSKIIILLPQVLLFKAFSLLAPKDL